MAEASVAHRAPIEREFPCSPATNARWPSCLGPAARGTHHILQNKKCSRTALAAAAAAALILSTPATRVVGQTSTPPGFQDTVVLSGLDWPTAVRFSPDGRVFVAEKSGLIKVFDSLTDTTPTVFADLRTNVHNFWDRGLLGLALHPNFPGDAVRLRALHATTRRSAAPRRAGARRRRPPTPARRRRARPTTAASSAAALSRLAGRGNVMTGTEQVLIEDWCQQFPSHSIGSARVRRRRRALRERRRRRELQLRRLRPGRQPGEPVRRSAGRPSAATQTPPTAEGGALRSQDLRTSRRSGRPRRRAPPRRSGHRRAAAGQPARRQRRSPTHGASSPTACATRSASTSARARNEVWIGDVGWNIWEEINRVPTDRTAWSRTSAGRATKAIGRQPGYDAANLKLCENLYARHRRRRPRRSSPTTTAPRSSPAKPARPAARRSPASRSTRAAAYPACYDGALFFADYSRNCIWVMPKGASGDPDPRRARRSSPAPRHRSISRSVRAATSSTSTSGAARFTGSSTGMSRERGRPLRRSPVRHRSPFVQQRGVLLIPPGRRSHTTGTLTVTAIRRFYVGESHAHLHDRRHLHGPAQDYQSGEPVEDCVGRHYCGQSRTGRHHRFAAEHAPMEGRAGDRVLRARDRPRRRHPSASALHGR